MHWQGYLSSTARTVQGSNICKGHVNNVTYVKYAESGRINWAQNFANYIDPKHKKEWSELWTSRGNGLILRSMKTDYKFVRAETTRNTGIGICQS